MLVVADRKIDLQEGSRFCGVRVQGTEGTTRHPSTHTFKHHSWADTAMGNPCSPSNISKDLKLV
mgnify:CR=1 FL=1